MKTRGWRSGDAGMTFWGRGDDVLGTRGRRFGDEGTPVASVSMLR